MNILAIDTCCGALSVALKIGDADIVAKSVLENNQQSRLLAVVVSELLSECGLEPDQIDVILVTKGPGSFTGIRIGLAFVLGFTAASNIKIYACSTLSALHGATDKEELRLLPASKGTYYGCYYNNFIPTDDIKIIPEDGLPSDVSLVVGQIPDSRLMINLFLSANRDKIFSDNLEPLYVRESYY